MILVAALLLVGCATQAPEASQDATPMTEAAAAAMARPPGSYTPDEVYNKLLAIADESQKKQPRPKQGAEFALGLPSEKPRKSDNDPWITSSVKVYYRDNETVNQITLTTEDCNIKEEAIDPAAMKDRLQAQVAQVTQTLFVVPFVLQDKYFRALGKASSKPMRVPIKEDYAPVVDMRLMSGASKCDGKLGFHYRYDFFMK